MGYRLKHEECEICGWNKTTLDLHHIIPLSNNGIHKEENLIALCPNCHRLVHNGFISDEEIYKRKGD